ncbi:MAG: ATP-binding cassette domain-containing protein, partial [Prosthecobacter sp.]
MNTATPKEHVCWGGGHNHAHHHQLEVRDLCVSYREVRALNGINFATECGRSIALIGPNGAGKSTLLKTLAGLMHADSGSIIWRGKALTKSSHEIAYLPQRGDVDWNFPITVRGLVEMGRYPNLGWWRSYSRHDADIVQRALTAMDLLDLQDRQINALSGGQQQRTFLARALA